MVETYRVTNTNNFWECTIKINDSVPVPVGNAEPITVQEAIKQMVEFWADWKKNLKRNNGDYRKTFLQSLARKILYLQCRHSYSIEGIVNEFKDEEGWWPMDGSAGIEIIDVDDFDFDFEEFAVEKQ